MSPRPSGLLITFVALMLTCSAAENNKLTPAEKKAGWRLLFDGTSLSGWRVSEEGPSTFSVSHGELIAFGPRSHLFYDGPVQNHDFRNFELKLDVKTFPKANSGVYFHTQWQAKGWPLKGYEIQVNNSHKDPKRTAGVYAIKDNYEAPAKDGEWFTLRIKVQGKRIETFVNDRPISDYTEEEHPERQPSYAGRLIDHGTFAIQGHDPESRVLYRNIKVRPLP
ncbi:MAG: DUF1080 domain-containing protein [Opitutaceae bacterium]|nr:DUF1080 domain-containing protein [Opitutaceae bacterium]